MTGKIICWIVSFGCAILFYAIGVFSHKRGKPMWFWAGSEVDATKITDVKAYNRENGTMWKLYSLWYVAAGMAAIWSAVAFTVLLVLGCTLGIAQLVMTYGKILKKYSV